jgi:hypothetical protein
MSTQQTPAPWSLGSNGATTKVIDADGKAVCMLTYRKDRWNGDLIAAAPDLLAALQAIVTGNVYGNPTQWNLCIDRGIAAIAKATGAQS